MPGLNRKGPQGMGPRSGGGRGDCRQNLAGQDQAQGPMPGHGRRAGGQGRGRSVWCSWGRMASGFLGRGAGRGLGRGGLGNKPKVWPDDDTPDRQGTENKEKGEE